MEIENQSGGSLAKPFLSLLLILGVGATLYGVVEWNWWAGLGLVLALTAGLIRAISYGPITRVPEASSTPSGSRESAGRVIRLA